MCSLENSSVMNALRRLLIEEIYVQILEDVYKESTATIRLHKISKKIAIQKSQTSDTFS